MQPRRHVLIRLHHKDHLLLHAAQVVNRYIDQGTAELVPGVLFIDEVSLCVVFDFTSPREHCLRSCRTSAQLQKPCRSHAP